jgi:hypothetical protein
VCGRLRANPLFDGIDDDALHVNRRIPFVVGFDDMPWVFLGMGFAEHMVIFIFILPVMLVLLPITVIYPPCGFGGFLQFLKALVLFVFVNIQK